MAIFQDQDGNAVLPMLDEKGNLPVAGGSPTLETALLLVYQELRLLRLGLCAARDSVCVDLEDDRVL